MENRDCIKRVMGILMACVCCALSVVDMQAQVPPDATLIDRLTGVNCEMHRAQIDNLLIELSDSPDLTGVFIVYTSKQTRVRGELQKSMILNHLRFRLFDSDRVVFRLGKSDTELFTELWTVPREQLTTLKGTEWNLKIDDLSESILIHADSWVDGIGCSYTFDLRFFSDFLLANGDIIGRVIIRDRTTRSFNNHKRRITKELAKFGVENKIEFAFIEDEWPDIEYWYISSGTFVKNWTK